VKRTGRSGRTTMVLKHVEQTALRGLEERQVGPPGSAADAEGKAGDTRTGGEFAADGAALVD